MDGITKPAITRIARRAGVKSMSDSCVDTIRNLIGIKLHEILSIVDVINDQRNIKTIMTDDIYNSMDLLGIKLARSTDLDKSTYNIFTKTR